jgi:predicted MFS family arabinose efflux permease
VAAAAASSGQSIGGVLANVDWRLVFQVNVVLGVTAIAAGLQVLPEIREKGARLPDALAVIALVVALSLVTFATVESSP